MRPDTHFLIVDDYVNMRKLVRDQLTDFGIKNITEKVNVDEAIQYLLSNPQPKVDFIISDWNMPGKTGLEFLKWVRSEAQFKNLPFLILTTENDKAKVMSAVTAGVSNFLIKPWEAQELASKIQLCWKKHNP